MKRIGNHRYVVRGVRDRDGCRWAIHATDNRAEAEVVLAAGVVIDGEHWSGVDIWDRRPLLTPEGGWGAPSSEGSLSG